MIIVCGHGRCGSSLVMRMLDAGGFPVVGHAPAFETDASNPLGVDEDFLRRHHDKAIKILDPHNCLRRAPDGSRAIWLDRDPRQQAKSHVKFMSSLGVPVTHGRRTVAALAASFRSETPKALRHLRRIGVHVTRLRFEDVLSDPYSAAATIAEEATKLGRLLSISKMTECVRHRSANCASDLSIEMALVDEASHGQ